MLKKELNKSIDYSELGSALKSGFRENFDFDLIDDSLTNEEIILAEKLRKEKYLTEEWNYKLIRENLI